MAKMALAVALWLSLATTGLAQEAARISMASAAAAEARNKAMLTRDDANFRLGPTLWQMAAGLDVEGNDNIQFESTQCKADLIVRPQLNALMGWRVSDKNNVSLGLGAGYSAYAQHSQFNRFYVAPGSEVAFDVYAADVWVNIHDRVSITENAYLDPTTVGVGDFSQLQNAAGVTLTWDLNKVVVRGGYDHCNYNTLRGGAGVPDGVSDLFSVSAGYQFAPGVLAGLENGGALLWYNGAGALIQKAMDWNIGSFIEAQVMEYVKVRAATGYTEYAPEAGAGVTSGADFTGVYARLGVDHRINRLVEYSLNGGRSISFAFFGGTIDLSSAVLDVRWHLFHKLSLGTSFDFEHGTQVAASAETFDRFGPGLRLERPLTRKVSASFRYQYYQRWSNVAGGDYTVNIATVSVAMRL